MGKRPNTSSVIPARKNPPGEALVYWMIRRSLRKHFHEARLALRSATPTPGGSLPIIFYANHPGWWDGYAAALLSKELFHLDSYLMIEGRSLRRYFFFSWIGCFSVEREQGRAAYESVRYITSLLQEKPGRALFIFPQGKITPYDQRPLFLYGGTAHIVRKLGSTLLYPLAIRYEFGLEQLPTLYMSLGAPHLVEGSALSARTLTTEMKERLTAEMDALRDAIAADTTSHFQVILQGKSSANRIFDRLLGRRQL